MALLFTLIGTSLKQILISKKSFSQMLLEYKEINMMHNF